jgi:ATP/ADP translocase
METLYMPLSDKVTKTVKTFLDVVIERTGDATAGFIILLTFSFTGGYYANIHFVCVVLIVLWMLMIALLRTRDLQPLKADLKSQGLVVTDEQSVDK